MDNYPFLTYIYIKFTLHLNIVYDILVSIYNYHDAIWFLWCQIQLSRK